MVAGINGVEQLLKPGGLHPFFFGKHTLEAKSDDQTIKQGQPDQNSDFGSYRPLAHHHNSHRQHHNSHRHDHHGEYSAEQNQNVLTSHLQHLQIRRGERDPHQRLYFFLIVLDEAHCRIVSETVQLLPQLSGSGTNAVIYFLKKIQEGILKEERRQPLRRYTATGSHERFHPDPTRLRALFLRLLQPNHRPNAERVSNSVSA